MMPNDATRLPTAAALRLGLLAGFLAIAGCSEPASSGDKRDDPSLKASMKRRLEMYDAKVAAKKGSPTSARPNR